MNSSRVIPSTFQNGPVTCSTCALVNTSCPAVTGVCVVNTLLLRTWSFASARVTPSSSNSRSRSMYMNAACPSLACQISGLMPSARSTRTPPTPSTHSCLSRHSGSDVYNRAVNSRSAGSLTSSWVSKRYTGTRPTITRQAPICTSRPEIVSPTRHGLPSGAFTRTTGFDRGSIGSSESRCQPSEPLGRYLTQEFDGIVPGAFPEAMVDAVKQLAGVELPAPPEILRHVGQRADALG